MLFWEVVPKYSADGSLLPEMILVCNALRNYLIHPNEYVRGSMLRFLCKITESEIIEPLVPAVRECLEHRHSFVRRQAALAVFHIHSAFPSLVPDAVEIMHNFIQSETDATARRNCFLLLFKHSPDVATHFLVSHLDEIVGRFGDGFALVVLELAREVCRRDPAQKSLFLSPLSLYLSSPSPSVCYEAAWTLTSLSSAPSAIRASAMTYANLLHSQSDNNIKLVVIEKLKLLMQDHSKILREILPDLLRALSSSSLEISLETLQICSSLIHPRTAHDMIISIKRELKRAEGILEELEESKRSSINEGRSTHKREQKEMKVVVSYLDLLIGTLHTTINRFPHQMENIVPLLLSSLSSQTGTVKKLSLLKDIVRSQGGMRAMIVEKLLTILPSIHHKQGESLRIALWIVTEVRCVQKLLPFFLYIFLSYFFHLF